MNMKNQIEYWDMFMRIKKIGRPSKITPSIVRKLEEAFQHGSTVTEACFFSGISRETYYAHYKVDVQFSDRINRSRSWLIMKAKHNIASAILEGDLKSSAWLLEKSLNPIIPNEEEIPPEAEITDMPLRKAALEDYVQYRLEMYELMKQNESKTS